METKHYDCWQRNSKVINWSFTVIDKVRLGRILLAELACCVHVSSGHLLAGKLAEHGGDVASILSHLLLDGLLHSRGDATRHTSHDVLKLQQWQRGITHGFHQPFHPLFQLGQTQGGIYYIIYILYITAYSWKS